MSDPSVEEREAEQSLAKVQAGGLPLNAERRLKELREGGRGAFTSDLSVNGFALCHQLGLTPLSQVMGSAIYQMGYQGTNWPMMMGGSMIAEMDVLSEAWNEVRRLAFNRLELEARTLGADAVVGVQIKVSRMDLAAGALEYVVLGTAVRRPDAPVKGEPVLTEMTLADYANLLRAGVEPAGIVACTSVFFATFENWMGGSTGLGVMGVGGAYNYEIREFTQAFYEARETVMTRLGWQAQQLGASGIVGVRISHSARRQEVGGTSRERGGLLATFDAIGTAVHDVTATGQWQAKTTIDLSN